MRAVHRYALRVTARQTITAHEGMQPLSVDVVDGVPYLYGIVDDTRPLVELTVACYGNGFPLPSDATPDTYLGSTVQAGGVFTFHYFTTAAPRRRRESMVGL